MKPGRNLNVDTTVVLFDPYFKSVSGHPARYARVLGQQARYRGLTLVIAANADLPAELAKTLLSEGIVVLPVFLPGQYFLYRQNEHQRGHAVALANQALAVLGKIPTRRTAWLSGIPAFVEAAVLCASRHKTPAAFQMIDYSRDWAAAPLAAPERLRHALHAGGNLGISFFAQGQFICDQISSETGIRFQPFKPVLDFKSISPRPPGKKITAGTLNLGYGFKDVVSLLPLIVETHPAVHWVLHFGEYTDEALRPFMGQLEQLGVEVLTGSLDPQSYNALWSRLDVTILPYDVKQYSRQGSGMLFEALSDGIVPIVPDGTSMADLLRRNAIGRIYDPASPGALQTAFASVAAAIDQERAKAQSFAMQWRNDNAPQKVFDDLEAVWSRKIPQPRTETRS